MPSPECKVYFDGSHYIAIPHTTRRYRPRKKPKEETITVNPNTMSANEALECPQTEEKPPEEKQDDRTPIEWWIEEGSAYEEVAPTSPVAKEESPSGILNEHGDIRTMTKRELFNEVYQQNLYMKYGARKAILMEKMRPFFKTEEATKNYVQSNLARKKRNLIARRIRLTRKANLQNFNYFVTFTYDGAKHTEETFKKKLKSTLGHFSTRKNWRYIGVWERSPEKKRLHFHGIFHIPMGTMPGILFELNDYNFKSHRRVTTVQNTYFNEKFGRCDFEEIEDHNRIGDALAYIMKYIEKSGEKIVYSKGLPQFFISDIMDDDIVCPIGLEDKKMLLFDDFTCWDEGEYIGTVSADVIKQLRKAN